MAMEVGTILRYNTCETTGHASQADEQGGGNTLDFLDPIELGKGKNIAENLYCFNSKKIPKHGIDHWISGDGR
jgi:hypothetical protein